MVDTATGAYRPTWKNRRRTIFGSLFWCMGVIAVCILKGDIDTEVARTAITMHALLAGGVIGSYVFGAVWDDKNVMEKISGAR